MTEEDGVWVEGSRRTTVAYLRVPDTVCPLPSQSSQEIWHRLVREQALWSVIREKLWCWHSCSQNIKVCTIIWWVSKIIVIIYLFLPLVWTAYWQFIVMITRRWTVEWSGGDGTARGHTVPPCHPVDQPLDYMFTYYDRLYVCFQNKLLQLSFAWIWCLLCEEICLLLYMYCIVRIVDMSLKIRNP